MRAEDIDDFADDGEQYDAHVETWVRFRVAMQFEDDWMIILAEAADDLRYGHPVNFLQALDWIDEAAADADFDGRRRHYDIKIDVPPLVVAIIGEVRDLLRIKDTDEALRRLNLLLRPKWKSEADCAAAYERVMAARRAFIASLGDFASTPLGAALLSHGAP